jgi:3-deoxy-7-phosphoheptulonate synthase
MSTTNVNVNEITELIYPNILLEKYKLDEQLKENILSWRAEISNIINKNSNKFLVIVGPCSIHNIEEANEYAIRLKEITEKYKDKLFIVMRVYFEKPRTTVGWKGLINDPDLNNTFNINKGLDIARKLLLDINTLGLPVGCEFLDTITPQYISDLVSWGAIGARTTESQVHRQLASGLSMPIGFKNGTGGSIDIAIEAVSSAKAPHVFLGVNENGVASIVKTKGNPNTHIILRGGKNKTNYDSGSVLQATNLLGHSDHIENVMIDLSHANSKKNYKNQIKVAEDIAGQLKHGSKNILGIMIESNIKEGKQTIPDDIFKLEYGVSVTDGCVGLEETNTILEMIYNSV